MTHRITAHAEEDLVEAVTYYESRQHGLGLRFALEAGMTLAKVLDAPNRWPQIEPGIHKCSLDHFPYALIYRIANRGLVDVLAIFDLRRSPGSWRS